MKLELFVACAACGEHHLLPVDMSGHYAGPLPCNVLKEIEVQANPAEWRQVVEKYQAEVVH